MDTPATVEMTEGSGVTHQGADTSSSADEASPTSQNQDETGLPESQSAEEQMIAKADFDKRVANMRAEYERKKQQEIQKIQEQFKGAHALEQWVRSDPKRQQYMLKLLNGEINPFQDQPQQDPYADFDPVVAEQFRKMDQLAQWHHKMDQMIQQQEQQAIQEAQQTAQTTYEKMLASDGFLDKEGNLADPEFGQMHYHAMRSALMEVAQDPNRPTGQEVEQAYKLVNAGLKYAERNGVKKLTNNKPPPTGSREGQPMVGKQGVNKKDHAAYIASQFFQ